jgi:hypothetical protein
MLKHARYLEKPATHPPAPSPQPVFPYVASQNAPTSTAIPEQV